MKNKRFPKTVLYGLIGLALTLIAQVPAHAASPALAEWQGYSNGVQAGGSGIFVPDSGFHYIHVDEIDLAISAIGSPAGDVITVQFTANLADGNTSTSGPCGYFQKAGMDTPFMVFAYANWGYFAPQNANGKRIKSVTYQMMDSTPGNNSSVIIQAHGFEY